MPVVGARSTFAKCGLVVVAAVITAWAGVGAARAATNACTTTGITKGVATKIFAPGAVASKYLGPTCLITPKGATEAAGACAECTIVAILGAASELPSKAPYEVAELKRYSNGHVSEVMVAGAGSGAVLVEDSNYGAFGAPYLFFAAGADTISIQGGVGGARAPSVFKQWEALARAIHSHLG